MSKQMPPRGSAAASVRTLFNDLVEETVDHQEQQQTTATVDDITRIDKTSNDSLVIEPLPSKEDRRHAAAAAAGPSSSHRNRFNAAAPNPPTDDRGVFSSTTGDHRSQSQSSSTQTRGGGGGKTRMTFDEMWEYQVKSMRSLQRNDGTLPTPPSRTASARVPTRGGGSANQQSRTQSWSSTHSVDEEELDDTTMGSEDGYLDRRNRALMRAEGLSSRGRCDSFGSVGSVDSAATAPAEMGTMRRAASLASSSSASSSAGNEERRRNSDGGSGGSSSNRKSSSSRTLSFLRSLMPDIAEEEVEKETPESVARKFQMKQTRRRKSTTSLGTVHTKRNDSHSSSGSKDDHHPRSHDDETPAQAHGGGNNKKKSSTLLKLFSERISSNMEDEISNGTTTSGERRTEKAGSTTESSPSSSSSTSSSSRAPVRRSSFKVNKLTSWRRGSKSNVMNVPRLGTASLAGECLGGEGSAEK